MCNSGTKIVPYDTTHILSITGTIITDDGQEGIYCFDRSPLSATTSVSINYIPPQVEVITVNTGSGVTDENIDNIVKDVWDYDKTNIIKTESIGYFIVNKILTVAKFLGLS